MEDTPTHSRASSHRICPWPELGAAGEAKPWSAPMIELASVGYEVQPAAAAPPSTKKLDKISTKAGHITQYDIMFSAGNAISRAPMVSGIVKLPKAPTKNGMITKKIMT